MNTTMVETFVSRPRRRASYDGYYNLTTRKLTDLISKGVWGAIKNSTQSPLPLFPSFYLPYPFVQETKRTSEAGKVIPNDMFQRENPFHQVDSPNSPLHLTPATQSYQHEQRGGRLAKSMRALQASDPCKLAYLDRVYLVPVVTIADLTNVVPRILRHDVTDLKVIAVHQSETRIARHHETSSGQYSTSSSP
uniref:Uncharacterized protein n=1 Tax=Timema cristinae TaxID=61476 RepID=A0A7R9D6L0_TIMCR|nr:unnamed protein product [Timema cristinae]